MNTAPIALFVYNRPWHTRQTLLSLVKNPEAKDTDLVVFSDGPKSPDVAPKVEEVRSLFVGLEGFRSVKIHASSQNRGLAASIIEGVTRVVREKGRVIVVEDDLLCSPWFLSYMNEGLDLYQNEEDVASIHGYIYPVQKKLPETFFLRGADCWGWATWDRAWKYFNPDGKSLLSELKKQGLIKKFDFDGYYGFSKMLQQQIDGQINSWAIRWHASAYLNNQFTLYPGRSLVQNIGHDGEGTHSAVTKEYDIQLSENPIRLTKNLIEENIEAWDTVKRYFMNKKPSFLKKAITKIRKWIPKR